MKPSLIKERIKAHALKFYPIMLKGAGGTGKTSFFQQVAEEINYNFILIIASICDPTDAKGVPGLNKKGEFEWMLVGAAKDIVNAKVPTMVLIDDFGQAAPMVQAAFMQWVLARQIGEHKVPDCVTFGIATNRRQDKAGVTGVLDVVTSRCFTVLESHPNHDDWIEWALVNDIRHDIIAWVRNRPEMLFEDIATLDIVNHCCPRTVEHVSRELDLGFDDIETLKGCIGEKGATDLVSFLKVRNDLPDLNEAEKNPKTCKIPSQDNAAAKFLIASALAYRATKKNFANLITYMERVGREFCVLMVRDAERKNPEVLETSAFLDWCNKNQKFLK